jgi:rubrerythrin
MVPPKYGREKIEEIIREEKQHVAKLAGLLGKEKEK